MIQTKENILQNIIEYSWFFPKKNISEKTLYSLVQKHQERLKPFGCAQYYPHQILNIWPGESPENILHKKRNAKNSLLQMFVDNCLQILRIMNLEIKRLQEIEEILKEMEKSIQKVVKIAAIEAAGLNVHSTIVTKGICAEKTIGENDIVDLAVEEACKTALSYLSWKISEKKLSSLAKYENPFSPLMNIFELGLWPLGIYQKEYIILVPGNGKIILEK